MNVNNNSDDDGDDNGVDGRISISKDDIHKKAHADDDDDDDDQTQNHSKEYYLDKLHRFLYDPNMGKMLKKDPFHPDFDTVREMRFL
jgi:hypothetical protein